MSKNDYPTGALTHQSQLELGKVYYIVWAEDREDEPLEKIIIRNFKVRGPHEETYWIQFEGPPERGDYWLFKGEARIPATYKKDYYGYIFPNYWHAYSYLRQVEG